ncbi:MAG: chorismate-binding protein [Candidatus Gracilibacteria bacterium]
MRLLLIDNYDSFTYNLYQQLERLGADVVVKKNDEITIGQIKREGYDAIVISPGPKKPKDSGISCDVVREFYKTKPILGVCLGHQCIGEVFGSNVVRAPCVMHGKVSEVEHEGIGIFRTAKNPFNVARYHSLILDRTPKDFIQTARTRDGIIMGIQHKKYPVFGVQFHPESFLTQGGDILIRNFLKWVPRQEGEKIFENQTQGAQRSCVSLNSNSKFKRGTLCSASGLRGVSLPCEQKFFPPACQKLEISHFDPLQLFQKLQKTEKKVSFLYTGKLEQNEGWSILAFNPKKTFVGTQQDDVFKKMQKKMNTQNIKNPHKLPFCGGWIGSFSYDIGYSLFNLKKNTKNPDLLPLATLHYYDQFVCFNHRTKKIFSTVPQTIEAIWKRKIPLVKKLNPLHFTPEMPQKTYDHAFAKIKNYILEGDIYQVNLTHRLTAPFKGDLRTLFVRLCEKNTAPLSAYFETDDFTILSASPERFLTLRDRTVFTFPVKGTRPRGKTPIQDEKFKNDLLANEKETAELNMITDLLRNDIGQTCAIGSVNVVLHRALQKCPTVWHTFSEIRGTLRSEYNALDLLKSCFPGGSITGCPKKRAMEVIDELEPVTRGFYTGALGYLSDSGDMDMNILIRTLIAKKGKLVLNVGGGIVADSQGKAEYQETLDKAKAFFSL